MYSWYHSHNIYGSDRGGNSYLGGGTEGGVGACVDTPTNEPTKLIWVQARPGYKMDGVLPRNLERKDLDIICPRKIRNRIADEIIEEWDLVGRELDVSDKKLMSIRDDCALTLPEKKAVAVLDAWAEEHGSRATCLKLAEALYRRKKMRVIEILCDEVTQMKRDTTMSGAGVAVPPQPSDIQQQEQGETK